MISDQLERTCTPTLIQLGRFVVLLMLIRFLLGHTSSVVLHSPVLRFFALTPRVGHLPPTHRLRRTNIGTGYKQPFAFNLKRFQIVSGLNVQQPYSGP